MDNRKKVQKRRLALIREINIENKKRCSICRLGQKEYVFEFECCEAAKKVRQLGEELLQVRSRVIHEEPEPKRQLLNHIKWRRIAESNGIAYAKFRDRVRAGIPMDIAATYTGEAILKWRERNDQPSCASR